MEFYIMKNQLSAKQKILNYLSKKEGYNTLSVAQARARFGIQNVSARVDELRQEGHVIYTNTVKRGDGSKVRVYRMGKPTKGLVKAAIKAGYSFAG
jgi:predicted transcriptional regulator